MLYTLKVCFLLVFVIWEGWRKWRHALLQSINSLNHSLCEMGAKDCTSGRRQYHQVAIYETGITKSHTCVTLEIKVESIFCFAKLKNTVTVNQTSLWQGHTISAKEVGSCIENTARLLHSLLSSNDGHPWKSCSLSLTLAVCDADSANDTVFC